MGVEGPCKGLLGAGGVGSSLVRSDLEQQKFCLDMSMLMYCVFAISAGGGGGRRGLKDETNEIKQIRRGWRSKCERNREIKCTCVHARV